MVEHTRPFDFVLPSDLDLPVDETRELVPASIALMPCGWR
jgi:hypothetical protein